MVPFAKSSFDHCYQAQRHDLTQITLVRRIWKVDILHQQQVPAQSGIMPKSVC